MNKDFDTVAELYDEIRPSYPQVVIDWILEITKISKQDSILEIGPGTGQATGEFARRGFSIHCIEIGKNLAALLKKNIEKYNVTVDVSSFEKWRPPDSFKTSLIYSATAFHWVDKNIKYKKCYHLLDSDGYLVVFWNRVPETRYEQVKKAFDLLWEYCPEGKNKPKDPLQNWKNEITRSGYFTIKNDFLHKWILKEPKEILLKSFFTQSSFLKLDKDTQIKVSTKVNELYQSLDNEIITELHTYAVIAQKKIQ